VIEEFKVSSREQDGGVGDDAAGLISDLNQRALKPRVNVGAALKRSLEKRGRSDAFTQN
jgi:hypothetical protein